MNGERITASTAIIDIGGSVLVNAAYLTPPYQISAIGPPDLFDQVNGSAGFRDFVRMRVETFGIQVGFAELKDVTIPAYAGTINLRYARPVRPEPGSEPGTVAAMRKRRNQLSIAVVALILGLLVVIQLRSQSAASGLESLSAQELTQLVANLNTRNDQLRAEIATTERELADLQSAQARGETSVDQLRLDLARVRAWTGLDAVTGPGVRVTRQRSDRRGRDPGPPQRAAQRRRRGARRRRRPGRVRARSWPAEPGALSVENTSARRPVRDHAPSAIPATLTGSLTRAGGIVAQLAATFPDAQITVVPVDLLVIPATTRDLAPAHGTPQL